MRQDEEGKREEAGSSRRQGGRRKVRKPDEEEEKLTELRSGHLGPVWVSSWGRFGGLWGSAALRWLRRRKTVKNDSRLGFTITWPRLLRRFP